MLCPSCGRETKKGLCRDCFLERNPISLKEIKVTACSGCGQFMYKGKWSNSLERFLDSVVRGNLVHHPEIMIGNLELEWEREKGKIDLDIRITAEYRRERFESRLNSAIKLEGKPCPDCSRRSGGYYEAILQFRGRETPTEKDINPRYVSKAERVKGGFDFYITSLKYARQTAGHYRDKGYKTGESPKQAGVRDGKTFYRFSISVKEA